MPPIRLTCEHKEITKAFAISYCIIVSLFYVSSLYMFVPARIRSLDRDNPSHIKVRLSIVIVVSVVLSMSYSPIFCENGCLSNFMGSKEYLGWKNMSFDDGKVLLHSMVLFCMPLILEGRAKLLSVIYHYPIYQFLRNIVIGPMTEEIVFRGCLVAPLLCSGFSVLQTTFTAALFFGSVHIHHLIAKLQNGVPFKNAFLTTAFQFTYTYLFGAFSTYAFIKTGSIVGISMSHSFCNFMGLPNLSFLQPWSKLYTLRWLISTGFFLSIYLFSRSFTVFYGTENNNFDTMSTIEKLTIIV